MNDPLFKVCVSVFQVMARKYQKRVRGPSAPEPEKDSKPASEADNDVDEELKETLRQVKFLRRELAARKGMAARAARSAQETASRLADFKARFDAAVIRDGCVDIPARSSNVCAVFALQAGEFADFLDRWGQTEAALLDGTIAPEGDH